MKNSKTNNTSKFRMQPETYYIWIGGSCDYAHEDRTGGGAYIMEQNGKVIDTYVIVDHHTTEFRMMLTVMLHAMKTLPSQSTIVFLTNVAYIQNFDKQPTEDSANSDLILQCISAKEKHESVTVKIISYHKFQLLPETHKLSHEAMNQQRKNSK